MWQLVNAVRENPLKYFELSQIMINIPTILTGKAQRINSDGKQSYLSQNWRVRQSIMGITSGRNRSKSKSPEKFDKPTALKLHWRIAPSNSGVGHVSGYVVARLWKWRLFNKSLRHGSFAKWRNSKNLRKLSGKEWFSNVAVTPAKDQGYYKSDEGAWYGKVWSFKISKVLRSLAVFANLKRLLVPERCYWY